MTEYIILSEEDIEELKNDENIVVNGLARTDKLIITTEEGYKKLKGAAIE